MISQWFCDEQLYFKSEFSFKYQNSKVNIISINNYTTSVFFAFLFKYLIYDIKTINYDTNKNSWYTIFCYNYPQIFKTMLSKMYFSSKIIFLEKH